MNKMTRVKLRAAVKELSDKNISKAEKHLEDIYKNIIDKYIIEENRNNNFSKQAVDKTEDEFYDSLTETYKGTCSAVNSMYQQVKDFSVKDIFQLTYTADGKTLEERIETYWKNAEIELHDGGDISSIKMNLLFYIDRLLINETAVVESAVKYNKIPIKATILVVEGGCTCGDRFCDEQVGEYPADELPPCGRLPPYHPNCSCSFYYEETDDPDDVNDLDLDIDEINPLKMEVEE